jgi:hypothetical protein
MSGVSTATVPAYGSEEFTYLSILDSDIESRYGIKNDKDDEPKR